MALLGAEAPSYSASAHEGTKDCAQIAEGVETHNGKGWCLVSWFSVEWSGDKTADTPGFAEEQGAEFSS